jgi:hypothetical protein
MEFLKELKEQKEFGFFMVLIKFSSSSNNFSCFIPKIWTVNKLKNFISYNFKCDKSAINIIYCGKILSNNDSFISEIFKIEEKINMIFVSYKQIEKKDFKLEQNMKDPTKFDMVNLY